MTTDAPSNARAAADPSAERLVGTGVARREDRRLLTGQARYTDNLAPPDGVFLAIHRSQYGHARIDGIDTSDAEAHDGVLGVLTWDDVDASAAPGVIAGPGDRTDVEVPGHPILARERVRYQGQPVAAVVATDRYLAHEAADQVQVSYTPLETVSNPAEAAEDGAPTLFDAAPDNVCLTTTVGDRADTEEAFAAAQRTVSVDLRNNRLMPTAMEPRAAVARFDDGTGRLEVTVTSQGAHGHRADLSETLDIPERKLRVVAPDVGGGFGHKGKHYPGEALAAWAAVHLDAVAGRAVRWTATRSGNFLAGIHGRDHVSHAELAFDDDGTLRGLRVETHGNVGGFSLGSGATRPAAHIALVQGQYHIPAVHYTAHSVFTTTAPIHAYRGAGRPEALYVVERLVDLAARDLGVDPAELRRQNQISTDAFPFETATGLLYDSGDYGTALDLALDGIDYEAFRERQAAAREDDDGRSLGVGLGSYVETTGSGYQSGVVRVHPSGDVTVQTSGHSHGQGHATTYAQIVADELGVDYDDIEVVQGDTDQVPAGRGTSGSRSTVLGGNAVARSAQEVATKARAIAAHLLEVAPADVTVDEGSFHVQGAPGRSISFAAVAGEAHGGDTPEGMDPGLEATTFFEDDGEVFSFGTHVATVEVDPDTGEVDVLRYLAVDDCGVQVNPTLVEGQVHGGVAQGLGQALSEEAVYDDSGNLVTASLMDYGVPKAHQVPDLETEETITPSPFNPLGVKGIGEGGSIASPPAVVNAVVDALEPFGVTHVDMPLSSERIWRAIHDEA